MKRLALAIALISSAVLLSGCIIVPARHGGYHGGDRYRHYDDSYDRGRGYEQPGRRY
ncbi:hypothetical protein [Roseateles sp.]|uniref:hypothetical protein n=1 Tax=Roseateles sp. TaxID=1971397 RepID=UPI003263F551